ncbi:MAG: hypothetical protein C4326_00195 [Ignavibacteria bacterium]
MKFTLNNILTLLLITIAGMLGSLIVGLIVYGGSIFLPVHPGFSFVAYGLSGGFIFAFYHVRGLSETITTAVVVSAVQFAISTTWITVLNAAIWSFGVNLLVVLLAFIFERKLAPLKQAKFVVVGLAYGAMFVLLTLIVAELTGVSEMPAIVFRQNFVDGLLIGIGLGIGVEGGEAFVHSVEHHRQTKAQQAKAG